MRRPALLAACALVACLTAGPGAALSGARQPAWLRTAVRQMLARDRAAFGAKPVSIHYLSYPRKIAVVVEFDRIVRCGCGPTAPGPGGRVVRLSFDRETHAANPDLRLCEVRGNWPSLRSCLKR